MKKAEVMDEVLDIFIRKAMSMEESHPQVVVTRLSNRDKPHKSLSTEKQKQKNTRSDMHELYTPTSVR